MSKIINDVASEYDFPFKDFNVNYDEEGIQKFNRWQDPIIEEYKKEIERLNNIIKLKTDFIHDLLEIIYYSDDTPLHSKAHLIGEEYEDKLKELKEKS